MADMVLKIRELRNAFDTYNVNRVFKAIHNFSEKEENLFKVVPALLHYPIEELDCPPTAPNGIYSFKPKDFHTEAFNNLFPDAKQYNEIDTFSILSLSLVGSIGTVAHTDKSDFDYVILLDKKSLPDKGLEEFGQKLTAIEKWAMDKLTIEVHFFLQDIVDFQESRFGITDKESVGSAEGKLFKDEFYRTAIFIAGKKPLWWIIPPGMPEEETEDFKKKLPSLIGEEANNYLDLGHIIYVEPQEFFGAALWQMNKFLSSPFKSLLKMALLESYLLNPEGSLLCEKLKCSVLKSGPQGSSLDPYIMMCERIISDYVRNKMPDNEIRLIQTAFLLKTGITSEKLKELRGNSSAELNDREKDIAKLLKQWDWSSNDLSLLDEDISGKGSKFHLAGKVNRFFLNAYKRLSDWLHKSGIKTTMISEKDLTLLGRKLFVFFEKKPGKVPFLLPGKTPKEPPACVTLTYNKTAEKNQRWSLFDFHLYGAESYKLARISSPVVRLSFLIEILTWTVINRYWKPECKFVFEGGSSPFKPNNIERIILELFAFFISEDQYHPERDDYLSDKRIVKTFLIPNFGSPHSPNKLSDIEMVFLNSWGEFFFKRLKPDSAINETADMFISARKSKKSFNMKIVDPMNQENSKLCKEFEHSVNMLTGGENNKSTVKKKKARLDTFT